MWTSWFIAIRTLANTGCRLIRQSKLASIFESKWRDPLLLVGVSRPQNHGSWYRCSLCDESLDESKSQRSVIVASFRQTMQSFLCLVCVQFVIVNERKWNAIFSRRSLIHSSLNFIMPIKPKAKFIWCSTFYVVVISSLACQKKVRTDSLRAKKKGHRSCSSSSHVYRTWRSILSGRISLGIGSFAFARHRLPRFETREYSSGHRWPYCIDGFRSLERGHSDPRLEDIFFLWNSGIHVTRSGVTQGTFACGRLVVVWCSRFRNDHRTFTISWHQSQRNDEYDLESQTSHANVSIVGSTKLATNVVQTQSS